VVDKFVEFFGPGLDALSLPDRATIANMAPEYGATIGFFPIDAEALRYLALSGRPPELIDVVDRYAKAQGLFRTVDTPDPLFTDTLELDMGTVAPSLAGPRRPQDRVQLGDMSGVFANAFPSVETWVPGTSQPAMDPEATLADGSVVIAAITSCTNTSNPGVMVAAGLLAKKAVERGLRVQPYVKTSLAPGSQVVTRYLDRAGLTPFLEELGFFTVGYGCTTCIGNSGPLLEEIETAIRTRDLVVAAVLSGNRNFEGRIHPLVKANYLASPPLVVAYAIAGNVRLDLTSEPLGLSADGQAVYLRDVWPSQEEINAEIARSLSPDMYRQQYSNVFSGNESWNQVYAPPGQLYVWEPSSSYIKEPPFFRDLTPLASPLSDIFRARVLAYLGDSITTDHISPAGSIAPSSPAGRYLLALGMPESEFNAYGARRGNHEVMMRGTFANTRIRNRLVPGVEGGETLYQPTGERMPIYEAAMRYQADGVPLIVLAGKEYGTGSSRDWAAKGPSLLGVRAVIAESFERIHRSNLVGMGVLPLQFLPGESAQSLGLTGLEFFDIEGVADEEIRPKQLVRVSVSRLDGEVKYFQVLARIDTPVEVEYYRNGGILQTVLRNMIRKT
jgi:aconitate hydratase